MTRFKEEAKDLLNTFQYTTRFWLGYDHDEKSGYLTVQFLNVDFDADAYSKPVYEYMSKGMFNKLVGVDGSSQRADMQFRERLVKGEDVEQVLLQLAK